MADTQPVTTPATPPVTPPATPPATLPGTPPAATPVVPPNTPAKLPQTPSAPTAPAFMTAEDFDRRLAEREAAWEAERVPKLREQITESITAPIRRDAKVRALVEELKAAGKYLPADEDSTDPTSPGDIAALRSLDDSKVVHTDVKSGKAFTQLDIELNRVRARLSKRTAKRADADALGTPPGVDGADNFYDDLRKKTAAEEQAARDARKSGLNRVFNVAGTR